MNFEQETGQILNDTLTIMAGIERRQAEARTMQTGGMALHQERRTRIALRLSASTRKLDGLIGFMDGHFRNPPN
jgi:hypothetical protein